MRHSLTKTLSTLLVSHPKNKSLFITDPTAGSAADRAWRASAEWPATVA